MRFGYLSPVFFIAIFIVLASGVSAEIIEEVQAMDCRLVNPDLELACGEDIVATCDTDVVGGGEYTVMSSVEFYIAGSWYGGTCVNCTVTSDFKNGTWEVSIPLDHDLTGSQIRLEAVRTTISSDGPNEVCTFSKNTADIEKGCTGTFGAPRSLTNTCVCEWQTVNTEVSTDNEICYTQMPTSGCAQTNTRTVCEFYDYCDPQWTAEYTACTDGTAVKSYYSSNPSCCTATSGDAGSIWYNHNTGSDCSPPIDQGAEIACTISEVVEPFIQSGATGRFNYASGFEGTANTAFQASSGVKYQPLTYDIDADGAVEIIAAVQGTNASYITVYSPELGIEHVLKLADGLDIQGPPVFLGVYDHGDGIVKDESVFVNGNPRVLVTGHGATAGMLYVVEFASDGAPSIYSSIDLYGGAYNPTGVRCLAPSNNCMFADDNGDIYIYIPSVHDRSTNFMSPLAGSNIFGFFSGGVWYEGDPVEFDLIPGTVPTAIYFGSESHVIFPYYQDSAIHAGDRIGGMTVLDEWGAPRSEWELESVAFSENLWVRSGKEQKQFTISVPGMFDGNNYYLAAEERVADPDGTGPTSHLIAWKVPLVTSSGAFNANTGTLVAHRLWAGNTDGSMDSISNFVVANDQPALLMASETQPLVGGTTSYMTDCDNWEFCDGGTVVDIVDITAPNIEGNTNAPVNHNCVDVALTDQQNIGACTYSEIISGYPYKGIRFVDLTTGTSLVEYSSGTYGRADTPRAFDEQLRVYSSGYTYGSYKFNHFLRCSSYADGIAGCTGFTGFSETTTSGVDYLKIIGIVDDELLWSYKNELRRSDSDNIQQMETYIPQAAPSESRLIAYNDAEDILLTDTFALIGYEQGFSGTGGSYKTIPDTISGAAFNYQWDKPMYMDPEGFRHEIVSWEPFSTVKEWTPCGDGDFEPVYYNSDRHILGIITTTPDTYDGPVWGYCDFSNPDNPVVNEYTGITLYHESYINNTDGTLTWDLAPYEIKQKTNLWDDSAGWSFFEYGKPFPGAGTSNYYRIWNIDTDREAPMPERGPITEALYFDNNMYVNRVITGAHSNVGLLYSADVTGNGADDLISAQGLWDTVGLNHISYTVGGASDALMPADLNSDGVLDMIAWKPGDNRLYSILSTGDVVANTEGSLAIHTLRCYELAPERVQVQVATSVPDPSELIIGIDPGDGSGMSYPSVRNDGTYVYTYGYSGDFDITVMAQDGATYDSVSDTCSFTADVPVLVQDCSLGRGSEFEYIDSITNHGWVVEQGSVRTPQNGQLLTGSNDRYKYRFTDCKYDTVTISTEFYPSTGMLHAMNADGSNVFGFTVGSDGTVYSADGIAVVVVSPGEKNIARIVFSRNELAMKLYINGDIVHTRTAEFFTPSSLLLGQDADWEYVRVSATGSKYKDIVYLPEDDLSDGLEADASWAVLKSCSSADLKDASTIDARLSSPRVSTYCGSTVSGDCSLADLRAIMDYNSDCMKEAYNYCTTEIFSGTSGTNDGNNLQGGTACSGLLVTNSFFGDILKPLAQGGVDVATDPGNILPVIVIIFVLVLVVVPVMARRR